MFISANDHLMIEGLKLQIRNTNTMFISANDHLMIEGLKLQIRNTNTMFFFLPTII